MRVRQVFSMKPQGVGNQDILFLYLNCVVRNAGLTLIADVVAEDCVSADSQSDQSVTCITLSPFTRVLGIMEERFCQLLVFGEVYSLIRLTTFALFQKSDFRIQIVSIFPCTYAACI